MEFGKFPALFERGRDALYQWSPLVESNGEAPIDVLDFFCGAGGMSLGFAAQRQFYRVIGGVDINKIALSTYSTNFACPVYNADITTIEKSLQAFRKVFGIPIKKKKPLVIIGCAPCQGFSTHRKRYSEKPEDVRNTLIGYFADIAIALNPDYVVMENVPDILEGKYKNHYEEAKSIFMEKGYSINQTIYNAAGFGVPQSRYRAIVVASKKTSFQLPEELLVPSSYVTVRDAIGCLPPVFAGQVDDKDSYHRCSNHRASTLAVINQIDKDGGSRPKGVGPECLDRVKGFSDVYGRLWWDKPAVTITQYARNPASGRYVHPEQNRGLTIREAARLQSFPDGFIFNGSLTDCFKQIGEAVPPLLSVAIATQILINEDLV